MNRTLLGLAVLSMGAVAVAAPMMQKPNYSDSHRLVRQVILHYTFSRLDQPIVVLGDSLVEASTLPRELCGRGVVNAGLDGASTTSNLGEWLLEVLDGRSASAIVVALGLNDALAARDLAQFEANYGNLLSQLSKAAPRVIVLGVPSIETAPRWNGDAQAKITRLIESYNSALPDLAARNGATFAALPPMPKPHTIDGIHLNAAGNDLWSQAVLQEASVSCQSK